MLYGCTKAHGPHGPFLSVPARGASLIEVVTVVLLLGILAAIAMPRFFTVSDFDRRGYFESLRSAVKYAQKLAIASDCDVRVTINASGYALDQWAGYDAGVGASVPVAEPGSDNAFADPPPPGVVLGGSGFPALLYFDPIGRPRDASSVPGSLLVAALDITVGSRTLRIEAETGFTRCIAGC